MKLIHQKEKKMVKGPDRKNVAVWLYFTLRLYSEIQNRQQKEAKENDSTLKKKKNGKRAWQENIWQFDSFSIWNKKSLISNGRRSAYF